MRFATLPDQAELQRLFHYDPETGVLTWRHRDDVPPQWNGKWAGREAGSVQRSQNRNVAVVEIEGSPRLVHRVIWKIVTGEDAPRDIDHRDANSINNRWANLRLATKFENLRNSRLHRGKALPKGVSWSGSCGRYRASIYIDKKQCHLGVFDDPDVAHQAYCAAATKAFGEFARFG